MVPTILTLFDGSITKPALFVKSEYAILKTFDETFIIDSKKINIQRLFYQNVDT
jgi:hypothetical protein